MSVFCFSFRCSCTARALSISPFLILRQLRICLKPLLYTCVHASTQSNGNCSAFDACRFFICKYLHYIDKQPEPSASFTTKETNFYFYESVKIQKSDKNENDERTMDKERYPCMLVRVVRILYDVLLCTT